MVKNAGLRIATCEDPEYFIPVAQGHVSVVHLSQGYLCTRFAEGINGPQHASQVLFDESPVPIKDSIISDSQLYGSSQAIQQVSQSTPKAQTPCCYCDAVCGGIWVCDAVLSVRMYYSVNCEMRST